MRALIAASVATPAPAAPIVFQNFPSLLIFKRVGSSVIETQRTQRKRVGIKESDQILNLELKSQICCSLLFLLLSSLCVLSVLCVEKFPHSRAASDKSKIKLL